MELGLHIADFTFPSGAAGLRDDLTRIVTTAEEAGFGKVEDALGRPHPQVAIEALIHASDGASDGIRKLDALARQNTGNIGKSGEFPIVTALTSAQLDLALGRSNVIHAALLAGPASRTFLSRSQILVRYRMADDDKTAGAAGTNSN